MEIVDEWDRSDAKLCGLAAVLFSTLFLTGCGAAESGGDDVANASRSTDASEPSGPPGNDDFADRLVIESLPFSHRTSIAEATLEATEMTPSCLAGVPAVAASAVFGAASDQTTRSVWYSYRPAGDITITLDPSQNDWNVTLAAYELNDDELGAEIGCVQSAGVNPLTVDLRGGQDYAIHVLRASETSPTRYELRIAEGDRVPAPQIPEFFADRSPDPGVGDATVIAVVDVGLSPYHWDFHAAKMPQAVDDNPANDLPLDRPPHEWLSGFPSPDSFASYTSLDLTLEAADPDALQDDLFTRDASEWASQAASTADAVAYHWIPGT